MNETTKNFWEAWNNWQYEPPKPPVFRCYHRADGSIITYSTELFEENWIEVDAATFMEHDLNARVLNGKLHRFPKVSKVPKLTPGSTGISCDSWDVTVIVSNDRTCTKWRLNNDAN